MSSSLLCPKHSSMAGSWSSNPLDAGASPPSCTSGYQSVPPVRLSYLHLVPVAMLWSSVGAQHKTDNQACSSGAEPGTILSVICLAAGPAGPAWQVTHAMTPVLLPAKLWARSTEAHLDAGDGAPDGAGVPRAGAKAVQRILQSAHAAGGHIVRCQAGLKHFHACSEPMAPASAGLVGAHWPPPGSDLTVWQCARPASVQSWSANLRLL